MGLFGYGKGTYKRNGDKAYKRIFGLAERLPVGYEKVKKYIIDASWQIKKSYSPRADFARIAAADARMFKYIRHIEDAVENEERAVALAYASLLPEVIRSRYFGEPEVRERELELKEELTIERGKRDSLLDGIDRLKRSKAAISEREAYLEALEKKLALTQEKCDRLEEELESFNKAKDLSDFFDFKQSFGIPEKTGGEDDLLGDADGFGRSIVD